MRRVPIPETILGLCLVLVLAVSAWGSTANACHAWKHELNQVASALTSNFAYEDLPGDIDGRAKLRDRARRVVDQRPFACF
jgi:hypothetical protein